jgi:hypothetical protein
MNTYTQNIIEWSILFGALTSFYVLYNYLFKDSDMEDIYKIRCFCDSLIRVNITNADIEYKEDLTDSVLENGYRRDILKFENGEYKNIDLDFSTIKLYDTVYLKICGGQNKKNIFYVAASKSKAHNLIGITIKYSTTDFEKFYNYCVKRTNY